MRWDSCSAHALPRRLYERAIEASGLDYLAHPLWLSYLAFEEAALATDKDAAPAMEAAFRALGAPVRDHKTVGDCAVALAKKLPADVLTSAWLAAEEAEGGMVAVLARVAEWAEDTRIEVARRAPFESPLRRAHYHWLPLDLAQLNAWHRYLDEELARAARDAGEGADRAQRSPSPSPSALLRSVFRRSLITCALYGDIWLRWADWLAASGELQEARDALRAASCTYCPADVGVGLAFALAAEATGDWAAAALAYDRLAESTTAESAAHRTEVALARAHFAARRWMGEAPSAPAENGRGSLDEALERLAAASADAANRAVQEGFGREHAWQCAIATAACLAELRVWLTGDAAAARAALSVVWTALAGCTEKPADNDASLASAGVGPALASSLARASWRLELRIRDRAAGGGSREGPAPVSGVAEAVEPFKRAIALAPAGTELRKALWHSCRAAALSVGADAALCARAPLPRRCDPLLTTQRPPFSRRPGRLWALDRDYRAEFPPRPDGVLRPGKRAAEGDGQGEDQSVQPKAPRVAPGPWPAPGPGPVEAARAPAPTHPPLANMAYAGAGYARAPQPYHLGGPGVFYPTRG